MSRMVGRHQLHTVWVAVGETRRAKALATTIADVAKGNRAVVLAWQQKVQEQGKGT
jgi:glycerol-3-phosphate acyltransferase PlsY